MLTITTVEEMDSPSLEIDYDALARYIFAVRHPSDRSYSQALKTRIGYAPQGLLSALWQGKRYDAQDSECMSVLFSLLISGFLPPEDQRQPIKRIIFGQNAHELTNRLLDDKKIGPMLGRGLEILCN